MRIAALLSIMIPLALSSAAVAQPRVPQPGADAHRSEYNAALPLFAAGDAEKGIAALEAIVAKQQYSQSRNNAQIVLDQLQGGAVKRLSRFHALAHSDTVVLVPDEQALLSAIEQWDDKLIFPVLIDDGWFAPIFVAAYQPKRIVRWAGPKDQRDTVRTRVTQLALEHNKAMKAAMKAGHVPPGLVMIDPLDDQAVAGVALAKAYGQPIGIVQVDKQVKATVDQNVVNAMLIESLGALNATGVLQPTHWTALTLAGDYPVECYFGDDKKAVFCVDDVLGRALSGERIAVCGRLSGDAVQANYQAMASMFLTTRRVLLADGYAKRGASFGYYLLNQIEPAFAERFETRHLSGESLTPAMFHRSVGGEAAPDFVWVNSAGNAVEFELEGKANPGDIPIGRAQAVYMTHSFSAQSIWSADTIAGRWLAGGGYWYFGSMHEPYLSAFTPPTMVAPRALSGTPVAFAARQFPGTPMAKPWRLFVIGNPLWAWREEPADRRGDLPLADVQPISLADDAGAIDKLVFATLTGAATTPGVLEQAVDELDKVDDDRLLRAVHEIAAADRDDLLRKISDDLAREHPIVQRYVGEAVAHEFRQQLKRRQPDAASPMLKRMLTLVGADKSTIGLVEEWLAQMDAAARGPAAREHLQEVMSTTKLPRRVVRMLTKISKPKPADSSNRR